MISARLVAFLVQFEAFLRHWLEIYLWASKRARKVRYFSQLSSVYSVGVLGFTNPLLRFDNISQIQFQINENSSGWKVFRGYFARALLAREKPSELLRVSSLL